MLHMREGGTHRRFADIILDLLEFLPPQLAIVDGVDAMHRQGPIDGVPLRLGCIAGAGNPVALDTALLDLLELDPRRSPLWQAAAAREICRAAGCRDLVYPALTPAAFAGSGFVAPAGLEAVRFNPFRFLRGLLRRFLLAIHR